MKIEKKQIVKGSDVLYMFFSIALLFTFMASAVSDTFNSNQVDQARIDVENLVLQIQSSGLKKFLPNKTSDRSLASVSEKTKIEYSSKIGDEGQLGKDPWGQPYFYKLVKDDSGHVSKLLVISSGPDLKLSTSIDFRDIQKAAEMRFIGDDIGKLHSLNQ
ncbi:MAG: type II secretion system protein GspG [Bdellovibrionales bacterium]|nr:type II secretion system protein GspG [Bdellovibrionales bacterium]